MFDTPAHSLLTPLRQSVIFNSTSVEVLVITLNLQLLPLQIYLASTSNDCSWNKRHVKQRGKVLFPPVMQSLVGDKPWPLMKRQVSRALQLAAGSNCQHWICIKTCCLLLWLYTGAGPDMKWNFTNWCKKRLCQTSVIPGPSEDSIFKTQSVSFHMPRDGKWIVSGCVLEVTSGNTPGQDERLRKNPQISSA